MTTDQIINSENVLEFTLPTGDKPRNSLDELSVAGMNHKIWLILKNTLRSL